MKIKELMESVNDSFGSHLATACDLISRAMGNPEGARQYRKYIDFIRSKHGREYATNVHQSASKLFTQATKGDKELDEYAVLGHEPTRDPKYLGPTEKVNKISVLNSPYGSAKQKTLSNKFFGAG